MSLTRSRIQYGFKSIFVILLLCQVIIISVNLDGEEEVSNRGVILEVGSGRTYSTITEALSFIESGDEIHVYSGIYDENIQIDGSILLKGFDSDNTIIRGMTSGPTITITATNCQITNLTITSENELLTDGIVVNTNGNTIINCNITKNRCGILINGTTNNSISKNRFILNSDVGLYCDNANNNYISNNTFTSNKNRGIKLNHSHSNQIIGNLFNTLSRDTNPDSGLVSHWKFDESSWTGATNEVRDSVWTNHGSSRNGAKVSNNAIVGDFCGEFDGSNDFVRIPNDTSLSILSDLTISGWIFWEGGSSSSSVDTIITMESYFWVFISTDGFLRYKIGTSPWPPRVDSTHTIPKNKWTHFTVTRKGNGLQSNSVKIYINRELDGTGDMTDPSGGDGYPRSSDSPTYIGKWGYAHGSSSGENHFFNGRIDDLKVYNKVLSEMEILHGNIDQTHGVAINNSSDNNLIKMNNFKINNQYGIYIGSTSSSNRVFHNNFIGNGDSINQVLDNGISNIWSNSNEGNYWDHLIKIDDNIDGIIDNHHTIDGTGGAADSYPLFDLFGQLYIYGLQNQTAIEDSRFVSTYYARGVEGPQDWTLYVANSWLNMILPGEFEGIPLNQDVGKHYYEFSVHSSGHMAHKTILIEVENTNDPPIITTENVDICFEDIEYRVEYTAIDIDPTHDQITWYFNTNAIFLRLSGSLLEGTPSQEDVGNYWVNISVVDNGDLTDSTNFTLYVVNVNDPPEIKGSPDLNCFEDSEYHFYPIVHDPDPNENHIWSLDTDATFLRINETSGHLYGTPENSDVGEFNVNIEVIDIANAYQYFNYSLKVLNTNDPPLILSDFPFELYEDEPFEFSFKAIDVDPTNDLLIWKITTNCSFLKIMKSEGSVKGLPENIDVGSYFITATISDGNGGFCERAYNFSVVNINDPPLLDNPPTELEIREDTVQKVKIFPGWFKDIDNDHLHIQHTTPENIQLTLLDSNDIIFNPIKDWNGAEIITISATDGEYDIEWDVLIKVLYANDPPNNVNITTAKMKYETNDEIILYGSADDNDLLYGDQLKYSWFDYDGILLGLGKVVELKLDPGEHIIILNVTDQNGDGMETRITLEVYEETNFMEEYGIMIVSIVIVVVLLLILLITIIVIRKFRNEETDTIEENIIEDDPLTIGGAGSGFSASLMAGGNIIQNELPSIMNQHQELPTSTSIDPQENDQKQLPPVIQHQQPIDAASDYIRPSKDSEHGTFKAPPTMNVTPSHEVDSDSPYQAPPSLNSETETPTSEVLPPIFTKENTDAQFNSPVWSPEMVESRLQNDAKSAVDLLHELNQLKNEGALTEEEYEIHKKRLLRKI